MPVACLDETQALAFVANGLPADLRQTLEDHVDDCGVCRKWLAELIRARGTPSGRGRTEPAADAAAAADDWIPGTRIARYVVLARIGRGAMGTVFRAEDRELGRLVALKRLHTDADGEARARLIREARSAAQLQHPNVVTVHEVGESRGTPFLAMELVDGVTLTAWLRERPRTWREIASVVAQAGRGLAAAHERGLVHRDFKPDNILIDRAGRVRVADFGLARAGDEAGAGMDMPFTDARLARMTATGSLAGTPAYLAPELVGGLAPDARSDQYAFAVTLHEALHGQHPFAGETTQSLWGEMAAGRIRDGGGSVPAWLERHVRRGLAVDPGARWPDVARFVDAIEAPPRAVRSLLAAGVALAIGTALWSTRGPEVDQCRAGVALVDGVWDAAARSAFVGHLTGLRPNARVAIASAAGIVDDWASAWRLGRRSACATDRPQRTARLACLDRGLQDLRAQLVVWRDADGAMADRAVETAAELPSPDACTSSQSMAPIDRSLATQIASVHALVRAGRAREARTELVPLLARVEATANPAALASALFASGRAMHALGEFAPARAQLARATSEAGRAGDDATMIEALLEQATVVIDQGRPQDSLGLLEAVNGLIERHRDRSSALPEQRYLHVYGDALTQAGRLPEALVVLRRAVALLDVRAALQPSLRPYQSTALALLAGVHSLRFEFLTASELLGRSLAIDEAIYGPAHPEVGKDLHNLAEAEGRLGRYDDAVAHLERARAIFVATYGEMHPLVGDCHVSLGTTAIVAGKLDLGRVQLTRGKAIFAAVLPADHPNLAIVEAALGTIERESDRCGAAIPHFERAVKILEHGGQEGSGHATQMVNLGACLIDVGRHAEAKDMLTRAIAEFDHAELPEREKAEAWTLLAEVAWIDGEHANALAIAEGVLATTRDEDGPEFQALREYVRDEQLAVWRRTAHPAER